MNIYDLPKGLLKDVKTLLEMEEPEDGLDPVEDDDKLPGDESEKAGEQTVNDKGEALDKPKPHGKEEIFINPVLPF